MKKTLLALTIPLALSLSLNANPENEDTIRASPGAYLTYDKTFDKGIYEIMLSARTDTEEDAWLFDGHVWKDVCVLSDGCGAYINPITLEYARKGSARYNNVLIHDHVLNMDWPVYDFPLNYMPPSPNDFYSMMDMRQNGVEELQEGVVDPMGLWIYDLNKDSLSDADLDEYFDLVTHFLESQGSDKFNFESEYSYLINESEKLGICLDFQHIYEPLDLSKQKSLLSTGL